MSSARVRHYGWMVSPYSAKTRSFLRYARVPFDDIEPTAVDLFFRIRRAVGVVIMPTVELPDGTFVKDSSEIVDRFERLAPGASITPRSPRQRLTSALLELFGDEWLVIPALYYRWTRPASTAFALDAFGRSAAPRLPAPVRERIAQAFGARMRGYLPVLGVRDAASAAGVERTTREVIAALDRCLADQPYVLGGRPCLGDFALYGPLFAHLYRDPGSTELFDGAPNVRAWIARMHAPHAVGDFLADDAIPPPLEDVLRIAFADQWPYLARLVDAIDAYCAAHPDAKRVPRALGTTEVTIGGATTTRKLVTFAQWKLQRVVDAYAGLDDGARAQADAWLRTLGGERVAMMRIAHPFAHVQNRIVLGRV